MQRQRFDCYRLGYDSDVSMQVDCVRSGLEMAVPTYLAVKGVLGDVGVNFSVDGLAFVVALASLYSAHSRLNSHYGASLMPQLEAELQRAAADRRTLSARRRLYLFGVPEEIHAGHTMIRVSAGLFFAAATILFTFDASKLTHLQDNMAGALVLAAVVLSHAIYTRLEAVNFGAQVVEVDLNAYRLGQ